MNRRDFRVTRDIITSLLVRCRFNYKEDYGLGRLGRDAIQTPGGIKHVVGSPRRAHQDDLDLTGKECDVLIEERSSEHVRD